MNTPRRPAWIDHPTGAARLQAEATRCAEIRERALPPADAGPVPAAPARGACTAVVMRALHVKPSVAMPTKPEDWVAAPSGYRGRRTVARLDAFDRMADAARKAGKPAPFTPVQVAAGRSYGALVERYAAAGYTALSLEGRSGGGRPGAGGYHDAVAADGQAIRRLVAAIGTAPAMELRRIRPSQRADGAARAPILLPGLVASVCVQDMALKQVLIHYGWSVRASHLDALATALAGALDRMARVI